MKCCTLACIDKHLCETFAYAIPSTDTLSDERDNILTLFPEGDGLMVDFTEYFALCDD